MKIRTQFILTLAILGSVLLVIAVAVALTNKKVESTNRQEDMATQVESDAYELSFLANDYLLYRESQQAGRWETKFASFTEDLASMKASTAEQQAHLSNMQTYRQQLLAIFTEIKAGIENNPQGQNGAFDASRMQVSWSRLEVQNQAMIFEATQLTHLLSEQDDQARQMNIWLSFILVGVFGAFLLVNFFINAQRIIQSLAGLQAGTRIIGSGNLDFSIPVKRSDEIGELSQAFNQMAADLKRVTASKADLEKEIVERKQAETNLRTSEERLEALYESMTEGIANHVVLYENQKALDYTITDVNPAFEKITGIPREQATGKKASELYQTGEAPYLEIYARVAASGNPEVFETEFPPMNKYFSISVFSPEKGKFATVFTDITERKLAEAEIQRHVEALRSANAELNQFNRAMVGRELRMIELKKEIDELCRQAGQPERYHQGNTGQPA